MIGNIHKKHKIGYVINLAYGDYLLNLNSENEIPLSIYDFISFVKIDQNFSEKFNLKIEELEIDYLTRYKIWYSNNFETGLEYNPNIVPDFENEYYHPTPKKFTRFTYKNEVIDYYDK
jgi:hypothetical protein